MTTDWTVAHGDCLDWLRTLPDSSADALVTDPPAGIGFMGKDWDGDKGGRAQWVAWLTSIMRECNRVLKPGAHALVWALPRTSHWTATAVEDAGFEVRDVVTHLFGSGFPKSLDVSKAIDARAGAVREVVGTKRGTTSAETGRGMPGKATGVAQMGCDVPVTAPATDAARQWSGWGTTLKPASEHWILARKPLAGIVAANVLEHGVGGINVDGCRIGAESTRRDTGTAAVWGNAGRIVGGSDAGRWPANVLLGCACESEAHDAGCAVRMLDKQSGTIGQLRSDAWKQSRGGVGGIFKPSSSDPCGRLYGDTGGASRFFYCAKPSTRERDEGIDHLPITSGANRRNTHATVKSIALMRYLARLITPPQGLVLDPFTGSGTTGCAAVLEGFSFAGCERESEYVEIARARIAHWAPTPPEPKKKDEPRQRSLFDL